VLAVTPSTASIFALRIEEDEDKEELYSYARTAFLSVPRKFRQIPEKPCRTVSLKLR
jgi:hypothetical protein